MRESVMRAGRFRRGGWTALLMGGPVWAFCAAGDIVRPMGSFDRAEFTRPEDAERVRSSGNLAGTSEPGKNCYIKGWAEYDIEVPQSDWYELIVPGQAWGVEYRFDGDVAVSAGSGKIGNFWLEAGRRTLRVQRYHWTGFQRIESFTLRPAEKKPAKRLRLWMPGENRIVRTGEVLPLRLQAGGPDGQPGWVTILLSDPKTQEIISQAEVAVPVGERPAEQPVTLACPREGLFELRVSADGRRIDNLDVPVRPVVVVDTRPAARGGELRKALIAEIDCAVAAPQFSGTGGANVVRSEAGVYRESGDAGFLRAQHNKQECGWFAYRLGVPEAQAPYVLEADYPDDAFRTFCIAIREAAPDAYPIAGGVDSGECYALTRRMQTHALLFWPRTRDLRVLFVTAHNGRRGAAVSKIRLYRVEGDLPLPSVPPRGGRSFGNWYEEGSNFMAVYGAPDRSPRGFLIGADRWARSIASVGGDTLVSTVAVYQMAMYPSRYNIDFSEPHSFDVVRVLLLKCEKYGLGFIGEFHPECRELDRLADPTGQITPKPNGLISKDGKGGKDWSAIPRFHPLHPVDREWYLGMIGEFVDRYKDSPAFRGVSLRLMGWANPGLNNFHSLDWGYDDLTVSLFEKETGLSTGARADDPKRFRARYDWLMANARGAWTAWRCRKIMELHAAIRDRVRRARPDLTVYLNNFGFGEEAGIAPKLLHALDGVVLVNAGHAYGRRAYTYEGPLADSKRRDKLLDPAALLALRNTEGKTAFLFGAGYFEATERVVPPASLGFPEDTKRTWMSGVVNPAGRHYLERYALALAEADAQYLSDGGNAYTLGQPLLTDFLREYRALPALPFRPREDGRDPVAVWELPGQERFLFYAVNRERFPVPVAIRLTGTSEVRRFSSAKPQRLEDGVLRLTLQPYELAAFEAGGGAALAGVTEQVPPEELARAEKQTAWMEALAVEARADRVGGQLSEAQAAQVVEAAAASRAALACRHVWQARTLLERSGLIQVYRILKRFPPALYDMGDESAGVR